MSKFSFFGYDIKDRLSVFLTTLATVVLFVGCGLLLDRTFDSKPLATILLLMLSYPVCQYLLYKKFIKKTPQGTVNKN